MWSQTDARNDRVNGGGPVEAFTPRPGDPRIPNLGRSVCVKGEVTGSEDLTLDGRVEGRIDLPDHVLTIGPNAVIQADITARIVSVFGSVVGKVTARDKVEVRRGGSLEGSLTCLRFVVQDGAHISGRVEMARNPRPEEKADPELKKSA